jgi:hypothetical protein
VLIIQFQQSDSFDADDDLEFRQELEELATRCLRAGGTGECDGGDIGSGTINVFCTVTDASVATRAIVEGLAEAGIEGAVIAFVDDGDDKASPRVVWPPGHSGRFSVL